MINLADLTWTCMVCDDERPDAKISVLKVAGDGPVDITVNVRYCNDRGACHLGAPDVGLAVLSRIGGHRG